jgi:hypothetical protein
MISFNQLILMIAEATTGAIRVQGAVSRPAPFRGRPPRTRRTHARPEHQGCPCAPPGSKQHHLELGHLADAGRQVVIGGLELVPPGVGVAALTPGDVRGEIFDMDLNACPVGGEKLQGHAPLL